MKTAFLLSSILISGIVSAGTCQDYLKKEYKDIAKVNRVLDCSRVSEKVGNTDENGNVVQRNIFSSPKLCLFDVTTASEGVVYITRVGGDNSYSNTYNFKKRNDYSSAAQINETRDSIEIKTSSRDSHGVNSVYETNIQNLISNNPQATFRFYQKTLFGKKQAYYTGTFSCLAVQITN